MSAYYIYKTYDYMCVQQDTRYIRKHNVTIITQNSSTKTDITVLASHSHSLSLH